MRIPLRHSAGRARRLPECVSLSRTVPPTACVGLRDERSRGGIAPDFDPHAVKRFAGVCRHRRSGHPRRSGADCFCDRHRTLDTQRFPSEPPPWPVITSTSRLRIPTTATNADPAVTASLTGRNRIQAGSEPRSGGDSRKARAGKSTSFRALTERRSLAASPGGRRQARASYLVEKTAVKLELLLLPMGADLMVPWA